LSEKYQLFEQFKVALRSSSTESAFLLGKEKEYAVFYVPFEYVNCDARLVLVGITPGPKQRKCSYDVAQRLLSNPAPDADILREIKRSCAFVGMRDRINDMLDHFGIPRCVGVASASLLWDSGFKHFSPTSIVPNATFKGEKYFNGPFSAVLETALLRGQFEEVFIPSIRNLSKEALYIGMGPVVDEALRWCASRGILSDRQILGYLPHASGSSGSQFSYFMRKKRLSDLKSSDPVRHRARDLDAAYEKLRLNLEALFPGRIHGY
jgi:hypothetical protein